jgi:hypothetical protein
MLEDADYNSAYLTASGAKALEEKKGFIAALEALRHPKPDTALPETGSSSNREAMKSATQTVEI